MYRIPTKGTLTSLINPWIKSHSTLQVSSRDYIAQDYDGNYPRTLFLASFNLYSPWNHKIYWTCDLELVTVCLKPHTCFLPILLPLQGEHTCALPLTIPCAMSLHPKTWCFRRNRFMIEQWFVATGLQEVKVQLRPLTNKGSG